MTSSPSLPFDVVEDILSRAPIESLIQCKPTSKELYALCKDKSFIYNHLDLSQERLMRFYADKVEMINPVTLDLLCLPVPVEFSCHRMSIIHCDGLLLCFWNRGRGAEYNLGVLNPFSGQLKVVESHSLYIFDIFGLGYVSRDSYKILRIGFDSQKFEIYDLKSKVWRAFSSTLDWYAYLPKQNVSMNGNMYWIAEKSINPLRPREIFIQSFDFSKETFKPICSFPFEKRTVAGEMVTDSIALSGFRGDRLSLFRQCAGDVTREMEVWVTNKVTDELVSWSKFFNVTRPDLPILDASFFRGSRVPIFFIHKTNSIMLWCDEVLGEDYACTSFYEIGQDGIKKQVETGQPFKGKGQFNPLSFHLCLRSKSGSGSRITRSSRGKKRYP